MAHEEAAFSRQHSAVSENKNQRPFTAKDAKDAEDAKEEKGLSRIHGKPDDEQERVQQRAEALALKLAQTYEELTRLLERNPRIKRQITEGEAKKDKVYQKLKQRLKLAEMAPRCQWVRQDGTSCGSPQMKRHIYCFAHMQMAEATALMLKLPPPEDPNAIQVGLMRIQKAVIEDTISMKKAGLLLYSMQLALTNVGQTTFGQAKDEEMVRETVDEEEALSSQRSAVSEKQNQHQRLFTAKDAEDAKKREQNQRQNLFTTEGTEDTEEIGSSGHLDIGKSENKNLPRMEAEDRGLQEEDSSREVEFVPVPGWYGFERVRLRIDSSGHRAVPAQPSDHREIGTPPRAAVPQEHAQPYANLG
jgi:hypothetical protein